MKIHNSATRKVLYYRVAIFISLFFVGALIVAGSLAASLNVPSSPSPGARANKEYRPSKEYRPRLYERSISSSVLGRPTLALSETIETLAADCTTPQSSYSLGDTVCVKVTDAPVGGSLVLRRFSWAVRSLATVRSVDITNSTQTDSFTLPSTAFSIVNGETVDNRGVWKIATVDSEFSVHTAATFTVHDPATPSADLEIGQGGQRVCVSHCLQ